MEITDPDVSKYEMFRVCPSQMCVLKTDCVEEYCSICHVSWKGSKDSVVGSKVQHVWVFLNFD